MRKRRSTLSLNGITVVVTLVVTLGAALGLNAQGGAASAQQVRTRNSTTNERLAHVSPGDLSDTHLSHAARRALAVGHLRLRERVAARTDINPAGPPGLPPVRGRSTRVADPDAGRSLVVTRNVRNTRSSVVSS